MKKILIYFPILYVFGIISWIQREIELILFHEHIVLDFNIGMLS